MRRGNGITERQFEALLKAISQQGQNTGRAVGYIVLMALVSPDPIVLRLLYMIFWERDGKAAENNI